MTQQNEKLYIMETLTSLFYDLAKAVPVGTLNGALLNSILLEDDGSVPEGKYCDEHLRDWAREYARQIVDYRTKFSRRQLDTMGCSKKTVSKEE